MTTEQTPRNEEDCDMLLKVRTFSSNMTFWLSVDCRLDTSLQLIAQEIFGRCCNFQQQRATCWAPNVSEFQLRVCDCWRVELRFVVRFSSKRLHAGKEPLSTVRWSQCHLKWKQCKEQGWPVGYSSLTRINMLEVILPSPFHSSHHQKLWTLVPFCLEEQLPATVFSPTDLPPRPWAVQHGGCLRLHVFFAAAALLFTIIVLT